MAEAPGRDILLRRVWNNGRLNSHGTFGPPLRIKSGRRFHVRLPVAIENHVTVPVCVEYWKGWHNCFVWANDPP